MNSSQQVMLDGDRLLAVFGPNGGAPYSWYVYGQGLEGRQPYKASREYLHRDPLGSTCTVVTSNTGAGSSIYLPGNGLNFRNLKPRTLSLAPCLRTPPLSSLLSSRCSCT
jgi:hypothetical protein